MSIMSMFRTATPPAAPAGSQGTTATPATTTVHPGETAPNPGQPAVIQGGNPQIPGASVAGDLSKDPMNKFKDFWEPPAVDPKNPAQPQFDPDTMFNLDPAKINEAASTMNFAQGVTQEQLQAVLQGGEAGVKALLEVVNKTGQTAFAQSLMASGKLVQSGIKRTMPEVGKQIGNSVRLSHLSSSLHQENPALAHPAAQPLVAAVKEQLATKYPTATPEELTSLANEYLVNFSKLVNAPAEAKALEQQQQQQAAKETDWDKVFLGNTTG